MMQIIVVNPIFFNARLLADPDPADPDPADPHAAKFTSAYVTQHVVTDSNCQILFKKNVIKPLWNMINLLM